jgi:hypothetical protein
VFFVGIATQYIGAQAAIGALGAFLAGLAIFCLIFLPWVRKLD